MRHVTLDDIEGTPDGEDDRDNLPEGELSLTTDEALDVFDAEELEALEETDAEWEARIDALLAESAEEWDIPRRGE